MAKLERTLNGDFNAILKKIENGNDAVHLSAIAAGGSQAMFFKVNTWGEEAFLDKLQELL